MTNRSFFLFFCLYNKTSSLNTHQYNEIALESKEMEREILCEVIVKETLK